MTNTTPEAVERLSWSPTDMVQMNGHGDYVYYTDYAALSAKLTTCSGNAEKYGHRCVELEAQLEAIHAQGYAKGLRDAAACLGHITRFEDLDAILALIPADLPAAKVTVQEAARVLLGDDYTSPLLEVLDAYNNDYDVGQDVLKALRAIAGGPDE